GPRAGRSRTRRHRLDPAAPAERRHAPRVRRGARRGRRAGRARGPRDGERRRGVDPDQPRPPARLRARASRRSRPDDRRRRGPVLGRDPPPDGVMTSRPLPLRLWLGYWRLLQRYHRYTVEGLEHLDGPRAVLVVGYHGRPFAYDMCMLTVAVHDRLGYLPHGFVHRGMKRLPLLRWLGDGLGFLPARGDDVARAGARGAHIRVTPRGAPRGSRRLRQRHRLHRGT